MPGRTAYELVLVIRATGEEEVQGKLKAMERFLDQTKRRADLLARVRIHPSAQLQDRISRPLKNIEASLGRMGKTYTVTIQAVDRVSSVARNIAGRVSGLLRAAVSPLTMLGAGAGLYGLGKLTLGAAMEWETQMISMEHWLRGNKALAQEVTGWLERLAAATPFEMEDLFPAMTRAVGISEGDIKLAERLVRLAADMAGLTPGKTVRDAMEALADAQMGEFERLKEFQMKMTQEEMKKLGGFLGFLKAAESRFAGGAEKLSETALGRLSTITDNIKTLFRAAGMGALEAVKPRLDRIAGYFEQSEEKVGRWRDALERLGRDAFDGLFAQAERVLSDISRIIETPEFEKADWGTKLSMLLETATETALSKAAEVGAKVGVKLGGEFAAGVFKGVMEAASSDPKVAAILGLVTGIQFPGPPLAKVIAGGVTFALPFVYEGAKETAEQKKLEKTYSGWGEAARELERRAATTPAGKPLFGGAEITPGHALGGVFARPHLAMVAEEGPEAVIPLAAGMRHRSLRLWEEVGVRLGAIPRVPRLTGMAYYRTALAGPVNLPSLSLPLGLRATVAVPHLQAGKFPAGGVVALPVQGGTRTAVSATNVAVNVRGITVNVAGSEQIDEDAMAMRIGRVIVDKVKRALENRSLGH